MSGFLDKKKRLIDFKLTEFGRDKISLGRLNFKYYTFSDASIFYKSSEKKDKNIIYADESHYLPFENDSSLTKIINPEIRLNRIVDYRSDAIESLFINKDSYETISDYLINEKYITEKQNSFFESNGIEFNYKSEPDEFDFNDKTFDYPTISINNIQLRNLDVIQNDKRFIDKIKNLTLPPINKNNQPVFTDIEDLRGIMFKSLNLKGFNLEENSLDKNQIVIKTIEALSKSNKVFKLDYVLNNDKKQEDDVFLLELHEVDIELDKKTKLTTIKLGDFFDNNKKRYAVYFIGKVILKSNLSNEIDTINKRNYFTLQNNYTFINMFTLVVK